MNRILPWPIALALLASCSTDRDAASDAPLVHPAPPETAPADAGDAMPDVDPLPNPTRPVPPKTAFVPSGVDLTPRPGRPVYPDCTATLQDSCLQVSKKIVPDGSRPGPVPGRDDSKDEPEPPQPPPPPPACPGEWPDCDPGTGIGSFGRPAPLVVDGAGGLEFAVGMDEETVIRELGDTPPAGYRDVNVAECMRVTLDTPAALEIVGPNAQTRQLPKGKPGDFWNWSIRPKRSGNHVVHAKVEVLRSEQGKCTEIPLDAFTRRVSLDVSAAGTRPTPSARRMCLRNGREAPCESRWWSWTMLGWLTLAILLAGLVVAVVVKGRRRRLGRGSE